MPRMIRYELKKLFSLPVLVLLAAAACILAGVTASRYSSFHWFHGVDPAAYRAISLNYAGPLDGALADRAILDWRALPDQNEWDGYDDEDRARETVLEQLAGEYAAAAARPQADTASMSRDAGERIAVLVDSWTYPAAVHGYYEGWAAYREAFNTEIPYLCALLVVFGLAPLFSGETSSGMAALCRTCRHGRWGQATAKLLAAALFGLGCAALCALIPLLCCGLSYGLDGGELPAAYLEASAYPLTIAGYAGLRAAFLLLGGLGLGAVMALLSSLLPSTASASAGAAVYLAPAIYAMMGLSSPALDRLMNYMPSVLFSPDPLLGQLAPALLFRDALWQPEWLALVWGLLTAALWAASGRLYLRRLREEPILEE